MPLVFFPSMHEALVPADLPRDVHLLDPGGFRAGGGTALPFWQPEGLPLDRKQAGRFIAESLGFGERFPSPNDLQYYAAAGLEDHFSQTSMAIRSEFKRQGGRTADRAADQEEGGQDRLLQAQMALLLAWRLEESLMDYQALSQEARAGWSGFRRALGLDEDEAEALRAGDLRADTEQAQGSETIPWPKLVLWFLAVLQERDCLVIADPAIAQAWEEAGVVPVSLPEGSLGDWGLGREVLQAFEPHLFQAESWRLALLEGPVPDKPWLEAKRSVAWLRRR